MKILWLWLVAGGIARGDGAGNRPLILVPGLTGSALEVQERDAPMPHFWCKRNTSNEWMQIWVSPVQALPWEIDCLMARMTLTYDAATDVYSNLAGVEVRALGWGNGTATGKSHKDMLYNYQFGTMLHHLQQQLGYELGTDVFIAPYDWRLAGDAHSKPANGVGGYYQQLQGLIEKTVQASGERAVVLSHSLGCPTMLAFFNSYVSEDWRAQHIHGWVALSGPWMGGATQIAAYLGGWTLGLPSWLVPHDYVQRVQVNASSGVWMSPHPDAFGTAVLVETPSRNYTAADVPDMLRKIGVKAGGNQTASLFAKLQKPFAKLQHAPKNVPLQNWYSTGIRTAESLVFDSDIVEGFDKVATKTRYGDGDGLVNLLSLVQVEKVWPQSPLVSTRRFPNCSHFGILSDARVLKDLVSYLARNTSAEIFV
ncbi:LCAT1 [Symbiodinium sp. CCMP2456]|nr:LCAT1 [Symbiodinium sp. CCMP2456]